MKALLVTLLALFAFAALLRFAFLCIGDYPRALSVRPWMDVVSFTISAALAMWTALVLWS